MPKMKQKRNPVLATPKAANLMQSAPHRDLEIADERKESKDPVVKRAHGIASSIVESIKSKVPVSNRGPAVSDPELEDQRSTLHRTTNRISVLTEETRRLERLVRGGAKDLTNLQLVVARLKDEKLNLNQTLVELTRENQALRLANKRGARQISALVHSVNRIKNEQFWSICQFIACSSTFEAYANSVGHDLTRLFSMLLAAEIRQSADLSPDVQAHIVAIEAVFDPIFYLTEYKDVALKGLNPLLHYVTVGYRQKRSPTPIFDSDYYGQRTHLNGADPLLHYLHIGAQAGLKPHPLFDGKYYLAQYPDVATLNINPLAHYQIWGCRERRRPSPLFDTDHYLEGCDLPTIVENPLAEYLTTPFENAVNPHPLFDADFFLKSAAISAASERALVIYEKRPDLNCQIAPHPLFDLNYMHQKEGVIFHEGVSPLELYCRLSRERDIDPSPLFDSKLYRYQMEIEQRQILTEPPIIDYLKRGYKDKTILPNIVFDPKTYIEANDVQISGPELKHYYLVGDRAGLMTHPLFSAKVYNSLRLDDISKTTALEHFLSAESGAGHISHSHTDRPLSPEVLVLIKMIYSTTEDFDAIFYQVANPDLRTLRKSDAIKHYEEHGKFEGRIASPRALIANAGVLIRDLPLGFFPDEYIYFNPDLVEPVGEELLPLFVHYLIYGRAENRTIGRWQLHLEAIEIKTPTRTAPIPLTTDAERIDVGVLMHIFYPDLWRELAAFARNFQPVSRDIFVNVVDIAWTPRFQAEIRELCPEAFIQLSNDRGRDIGGFVRLLDHVDIKKYDLFAWIHSKKSPHIAEIKGEYWRRSLLRAFAGTEEIVAECVRTFRDDPSVGLIAAREWRCTELGRNAEQYYKLLDLFEIDEKHRQMEYVSGTMFLMRAEIVQRLYDGLKNFEWEYGGDKGLDFHTDGQVAHAVERLIGNLVRQMGYQILWR
jgi:Rhamnan synthesis protein F